MQLKASVTGTKGLRLALRRYGSRAPQALARELYAEGIEIQANAESLTPIDTGALVNSARTELPQIAGNRVSVVVGFGGPAAPYAVYVHEDLNAHHEVGQAKFLEASVNNSVPGMATRIARRLRRKLKTVGGN